MKKLTVIFVALLFSSCYRTGNLPPDNTPPAFDIKLSGYSSQYNNGGDLKDSLITFTVNDSDSLVLDFSFSLISGNPLNYRFKLYTDSLPAGITASPDSILFGIAYSFAVKLQVIQDTGYKTVNFKVYDSALGLQIYPIRLHIMPPVPPPDCSDCMIRSWVGISCNTDTCNPIVTAISGMPHWVAISNINCLGDSVVVNAYVSCTTGISIPVQTSHGYTIYGGIGSFPCGQFVAFPMNDTIVHNGDTTACMFEMESL